MWDSPILVLQSGTVPFWEGIMLKKNFEWEPIYKEPLSKNCMLVVFCNKWQIEYQADTFEEDKDLKYKVSSEKLEQFLFDCRKNLQLFYDMNDAEKVLPPDMEGLRDMILRFRTQKPGVYLTETFCLMTSQADYDEIEAYIKKAKEIAPKIQKEWNAKQ